MHRRRFTIKLIVPRIHIRFDRLANGNLESMGLSSRTIRNHSFSLHHYSTRSDSLDLRVVDVPKLLCTTYQLKEQMTKISEQHQQQQQQQQQIPLLPLNGDIKRNNSPEPDNIRLRITELEQELNQLRLQLSVINQT